MIKTELFAMRTGSIGSVWSLAFTISFQILLFYSDCLTTVNGCVCLGDTLTYNCTVMGTPGGYTIWRGTAFRDCISNEQETILLHLRFTSNGGTSEACNNGDIVARSLGVEGNNYISRLNVTVTPDVIGKTIMCSSEATNEINAFSTTITTTGPLPPPKNVVVSAVNFYSRSLIFSWSVVTAICPSLHYNILSSNCGSCPTTTTNTTVTCTDVPTDGSVCTFAVQTVICGNITSDLSDYFNLTTETFLKLDNVNIQSGTSTPPTTIATVTGVFATILFLWAIVSTSANIVLVCKAKVKMQREYELSPTTKPSSNSNRKSSAIDTKDNAAYGLTVFN